MQYRKQAGFTIIELMIATMVFAVILLGATSALFQLERMYYKGIITDQTQTTSRQIMASISQQLQLGQNSLTSGSATYGDVTVQAICIANTRFSYLLNGQVDATASGYDATHHIQHGLWRDTIGPTASCIPLDLSLANPESTSGGVTPGSNGTELLGQHMRLGQLDVSCSTSQTDICTINLNVIYGDDDLLAPDANNPTGCKTTFGDQWCASSGLQTTVNKRLKAS